MPQKALIPVRRPLAHLFDATAQAFALQTPLLRRPGGLGCLAQRGWLGHTGHQCVQALQTIPQIVFLRAVFLRLDDHHAFGGDA